ncbi:MAG: hypothetical protein BJ554DRAFT_2293, partial [Olpidium bornovanus]
MSSTSSGLRRPAASPRRRAARRRRRTCPPTAGRSPPPAAGTSPGRTRSSPGNRIVGGVVAPSLTPRFPTSPANQVTEEEVNRLREQFEAIGDHNYSILQALRHQQGRLQYVSPLPFEGSPIRRVGHRQTGGA